MKYENGLWWPDSENHLNNQGASYQQDIYDLAMKYIPPTSRNVFVDVGAHVGIFTLRAAPMFGEVHSFEPMPSTYSCLKRNVEEAEDSPKWNVSLYNHGISAEPKQIKITWNALNTGNSIPTNDMSTFEEGDYFIEAVDLDYFNFQTLNLMKIDVEGFELEVLKGATETIKRCRPVIIMEVKGNGVLLNDTFAPIRYLRDTLDYEIMEVVSHDYVLIPKRMSSRND